MFDATSERSLDMQQKQTIRSSKNRQIDTSQPNPSPIYWFLFLKMENEVFNLQTSWIGWNGLNHRSISTTVAVVLNQAAEDSMVELLHFGVGVQVFCELMA